MEDRIGRFALSLAGHDKGKLYLTVGYEEGFFLLADGRLKTVEKPKKKKAKHLQFLDPEQAVLDPGRPVRNEEVKRAIKMHLADGPSSRR